VSESARPFHLFELFGLIIAPAAFGEERVENEHFFVIRPAAMRETPLEDLLVCSSGKDLLRDGLVIHLQKSADPRVRAGLVFIVGRQFSRRVQADFIEHPAEENQAADQFGRMPQARNFHNNKKETMLWLKPNCN
jgi:hypothetical protein